MLSKFLKNNSGLYVQPRMGMGSLEDMRKGLEAVKELDAPTVGTITLDSYTRMGQFDEAKKSLQAGLDLNGLPILAYEPSDVRERLSSVGSERFLIQVRHGTAYPEKIFGHLIKSGLFLTEGGPISYCLPYSRSSLREAIASWQRACLLLADYPQAHLESFAGCLLGQLCHPSILVSLGILEALFFEQNGLKDISLSYAQNYNLTQDLAAISALRRLADRYLSEKTYRHIVVYTFMGLFPETGTGYEKILKESVHLAILSGAKRLIVKTHEESRHIPTVASNLAALKKAYECSSCVSEQDVSYDREEEELIFSQSKALIDCALNLDKDMGAGLFKAFQKGYLDVPFCLHPDNHRLATCTIDHQGYLQWFSLGKLPIAIKRNDSRSCLVSTLTSENFLEMLAFNRKKFDTEPTP